MPEGCDCIYCKPDASSVHGAWREDEADKYDWAPVVQNYTETYSDGVSPEAKSYFQKKLQQYGYAKHPAPVPSSDPLEDAGFYTCPNCQTMALINEHGLCRYCDELSALNRSEAVMDGHKQDYLKARHSVTINRRIYWGMLSLWAVLMALFAILGWGEVLASGGIISTLAMILATPGYCKDTNRYKKQAAKVLEEHPELQYLAARATSGSTGPR